MEQSARKVFSRYSK